MERLFESRHDCLEEGIFYQVEEDVPRAGAGITQGALYFSLRGDFVSRLIFKQSHDAIHQAFIHLLEKPLLLILGGIVDLDLFEKRLHIPINRPALHGHFTEKGEGAGVNIRASSEVRAE